MPAFAWQLLLLKRIPKGRRSRPPDAGYPIDIVEANANARAAKEEQAGQTVAR